MLLRHPSAELLDDRDVLMNVLHVDFQEVMRLKQLAEGR